MKFKKDRENNVTSTNYWTYDFIKSNANNSVLKKGIKKLLNNLILHPLGFKIVRNNTGFRSEQKSFTTNEKILTIRNNKLCNYLLKFGDDNGLNFHKLNILQLINRYDDIFRDEKISDLNGGMGYNNGLFLFILTSFFDPKGVIESGVWRGFTTFLIDQATSKSSKLFCFDINLDRNEYISKKASYFECDINEVNNCDIDFKSVDLAFFDDHVSIFDRLNFCMNNKIGVVIVDDDVSLTQVHSDGWPPIPTASMVYNYDTIPKKFEWITNGNFASADISGLNVKEICNYYNYIPFPDSRHFTGYNNTSLTSLLIKKNTF